MRKPIKLLLFLIASISGCGEFAYKQGGTPRDLEQAKKTCEASAQNATSEQTKAATECLERQGWTVKHLDDDDLFATATYSASNPNQIPNKPTDKPYQYAAKEANPSNKAVDNGAGKPGAEAQVKFPEPSPLDTYIINSWWKMGGNGLKMQSDIDACVGTLGEAHKPNQKTQEVTRGLILCMREKGWVPLKAR